MHGESGKVLSKGTTEKDGSEAKQWFTVSILSDIQAFLDINKDDIDSSDDDMLLHEEEGKYKVYQKCLKMFEPGLVSAISIGTKVTFTDIEADSQYPNKEEAKLRKWVFLLL